MKAEILRTYLPTETLGSFMVAFDSAQAVCVVKTMELPDKQNQRRISCIPEGIYTVKKEIHTETHPYPHFRIVNVPNRDGILIHKITYVSGLLGCVGVGSAFADLNKDGVPDITGSTVALDKLYNLMPDSFELTIRKKP